MSGTTTNYALRYPTSGDNIAPLETHFKNLADDVDGALGSVPIVKHVGSAIATTNSAGFTTVETTTDTITVALVSGKLYEVRFVGTFNTTVASDKVTARLYDTNTSGTKLYDTTQVIPNTTSQITIVMEAEFTAPATANRTFIVTALRFSGTGTLTRVGAATLPSRLSVKRIS